MTSKRHSDVDEEERAQQMGIRREAQNEDVHGPFTYITLSKRCSRRRIAVIAGAMGGWVVQSYSILYVAVAGTYTEAYKLPYANLRAYTRRARADRSSICAGARKDPRLHLQTVKAINEHAKPRGTNLIQLGNCERF